MSDRVSVVVGDATVVADERELGGKGAQLVRLVRLGLPVPPFVVVTRHAFEQAVGGRAWLDAELGALEAANPGTLGRGAARIAARIRDGGCPEALARALAAALAERGLPGQALAVRSSGVGEDSARHSFAGLLESRLNIRAEAVQTALVEVWASAFSARVLAYRQRKCLPLVGATTAAVVQQLVAAESSGVLFSRDPEPGQAGAGPRCRIVAAWGLGEGVVQGAVEVDTYRIEWEHDAVERQPGAKRERVMARGRHGTRTEVLPARLRRRGVLSSGQVRELRALAVGLERALGAPQDIEWAYDARGRLFVLQARPIVPAAAPAGPATAEERRLFDDANVVESYPGLTLPLTFSFVRDAYARAFRRAAAAFFPLRNPLAGEPQLFESLLGLLEGRVYYNLDAWHALHAPLASPARHRRDWNRMVGISGAAAEAAPAAPPGPLWQRTLAALSAARILVGLGGLERRFRRRFEAFYARHRPLVGPARPGALARRYRRLAHEAEAFWHLTLFVDLCVMRYAGWLRRVAGCSCADPDGLVSRLLAGAGEVESLEPVRSLQALAARVAAVPAAREVLATADAADAWRRLQEDPCLAPLREACADHIERFGDRGLEELKLETLTLRERPEELVALVRRQLETGARARERERQQVAQRCAAEAQALGRLPLPERVLFRLLLGRTRAAIRCREGMRLARARLFGLVRRLFRELGAQLEQAGVLASTEDVFYLGQDEVLGCVEGTGFTHDLRALVALRRREYAAWADRAPAGRCELSGLPGRHPLPRRTAPAAGTHALTGTACAPGVASGPACVVTDPAAAAPRPEQVLVTRSTDPGWVFLMLASAGLVAERGSLLSHTAIVGRELGIPTVVGVEAATERIPDGVRLTIDGGTGEVRWA